MILGDLKVQWIWVDLHVNSLLLSYTGLPILNFSVYLYAGKITALSLVYGGPGLHFFPPCLYDALVNGVDKVQATVDDACDQELKSSLQKLSQVQAVPGVAFHVEVFILAYQFSMFLSSVK